MVKLILFGYIKCYKSELKVIEYDSYKAIYCGLCKRLKESYGFSASFTLSYDFAFLAILKASLDESCMEYDSKTRCTVNPFKKVICCTSSSVLDYSCDMAMIILYHKLKDNIADGKTIDRIKTAPLLPFATSFYKKSRKKYPEISDFIEENMTLQKKLELENTSRIDDASNPSAKSLAFIFENLAKSESEKRILNRLGYFLGRWVYLIDAVDDMLDDQKNGCYNVLLSQSFTKETYSDAKKSILPSLNLTLGEIINAYELLEVQRFKPILDNILYMGLPNVQKGIINNTKTSDTLPLG